MSDNSFKRYNFKTVGVGRGWGGGGGGKRIFSSHANTIFPFITFLKL